MFTVVYWMLVKVTACTAKNNIYLTIMDLEKLYYLKHWRRFIREKSAKLNRQNITKNVHIYRWLSRSLI